MNSDLNVVGSAVASSAAWTSWSSLLSRPARPQVKEQLKRLTLSNKAVEEFEAKRRAAEGETVSPLYIKLPYFALCFALDVIFEGRPIQVRPASAVSAGRTWYITTGTAAAMLSCLRRLSRV